MYPTHLPNCDVFELRGEGEDTEELDLAEGRLHKLVVRCHGFTRDVVVAGNATQVGHLWEREKSFTESEIITKQKLFSGENRNL